MTESVCKHCGKSFHVRPSDRKLGRGVFCSQRCRDDWNADAPARFWSFVDKTGDCWLWTGAKSPSGYGVFMVDGKYWRAHRYAYTLTHGEIGPGLRVCHHCDNPGCVRPDHLFLGIDAENIADCQAKGRRATGDKRWQISSPERIARGNRLPFTRLTESQVIEIRQLHSSGVGTTTLARRYGVADGTISNVVRRKSFKYVP